MVVPTFFLNLFVGCAHAADLFVVMKFRVIALPAQGIEPETGDGLVKIVLAESCGDVLAKLEGIKRWRVQPTMLRGARKVAAHGDETGLSGMGQKKRKRLRVRTKKGAKKELIPKGKKKKKTHNVPEVKGADEVTEKEICRTPEGRAMIKLLLQNIYEMDQHVHPSAPVFGSDGRCRLKFEGASMFTWEGVLDAAPAAMEAM